MNRAVTWLLLLAVSGIALAAAVDALRGEDAGAEEPEPPAATEAVTVEVSVERDRWRLRAIEELEQGGARGALLVADEECNVVEVALPSLVERRQHRPVCAFSTTPRGWFAPDPRVVAPGGEMVARCVEGVVELYAGGPELVASVPGCSPAWSPHGLLSVIRDGTLVVVRPCRNRWDCEEALVGPAELDRLLGRDPWGFEAPQLRQVAWLSRTTFAALVRDPELGQDAIVVLRGDELVGGPPFAYEELGGLRASPRGGFAAARIGERGLVVVNGEGSYVGTTFRTAHAIAWSPDERWTAFATGDGVYLVRREGGSRPLLLPYESVDVAWR